MANPSSTLLLEPDPLLAQALLRQLPPGIAHTETWPEMAPAAVILRASVMKSLGGAAKQASHLLILMDESAPLPDHATAIALPVRRDRLRAALEGRAASAGQELGSIGHWHPAQRKLTSLQQGGSVTLTEKEAALFTLLHESADGLDADTLRQLLWPDQQQVSPHALPALLSRLRGQVDACFGDALTIAQQDGRYHLAYA